MTKAGAATLVRVLGPVDTIVNGTPVALSTLERGLLAALVARAGRVASIDLVIDTLWGDAAPGSARNRVHALVSSVRRTLVRHGGQDLIVTSSPGYLLARRPETIDAVRFETSICDARQMVAAGRLEAAVDRYRKALDLWRGTPFDGAGSLRTAEIHAELTRLEESRLTAIEERIDAELALGQAGQLIGELTALVTALPFRERLRGQLMLALYRCGRQAEAAATYRDGYRLFADELGSEPGTDLQSIHSAILSGRVDVLPGHPIPVVVTVPAAARQPATVALAEPGEFAGRTAELGRIRAVLNGIATDATLICISGMGGVGKTTLAMKATNDLGDTYPDGRLWLDMRGTEASPRTTTHAMASVLIATGTAASAIPDDRTTLVTAYQAALSYNRLVIVLDNVAGADQVAALRPPPSARSAVLTTSRAPLPGLSAALEITLDVLPVADARAMLAALIGAARITAEPAAADRLLEQCGRLPLAIRVVGARLANQSEHRLARVVERMAHLSIRLDATSDDRQVRAGLTVLYPRLAPSAARLLRLVAQLPTPELSPWLAAAAADVRPDQAEAAYAALVGSALATEAFDAGGVRYRVHDLIRGFARDLSTTEDPPAERDAALRRAFEALLCAANDAASRLPSASFPLPPIDPQWRLVPPDVVTRAGGPSAWFAMEHELIFGAIHECLGRHWWELAWRLLIALTVDVGDRGATEEWCTVAQVVLERLEGAGNEPLGAAMVRLAAGGHLRNRQRTSDSIGMLRRARLEFRRLGDDVSAAVAAGQLAMAYRTSARFRPGRIAFEWALRHLPAEPTTAHYLAQILVGYGNLLLDTGDRDGAARAYQDALAGLELRPNPAIEANALASLGNVYTAMRDFDQAIRYFERARAELETIGDLTNIGWVELGLGHALLNQGDDAGTGDAAARALTAFRDVGENNGYSRALALEGRLLVRQGNGHAAVIVLREAAARLESAGHAVMHRRVLEFLADAHDSAGDPLAAAQIRARARPAD